ncbi:MAG: invasion protein [Rubritepida sp.]|nr:invasion protein [Rubritepida sp.]
MKAGASLALLAAFYCAPAAAQSPRPAPPVPAAAPPPAPRPERTTASYGDWTLRCEQPANLAERSCEVAQPIMDARGQPIAQMVVKRGTEGGSLLVSVQVATNISLPEPVQLLIEDQTVLTLTFRRCLPRGCFAEVEQRSADVFGIARRGEAAKLEYRDAAGALVSVPMPLRGLVAALEALARS